MKDLVGISAGSLENQLAEHWAYFLGEIPTALVKALRKLL